MEHVVFDEKINCPECGKEMATGKIYGIELVDWNGHRMKVKIYYDYCPACRYYKVTR